MIRNDSPFWDLVEREHRSARAYCTRLALNPDEGDDLYQDSVLKAFRGFSELRNPESFRPWFYQIINNSFKARARNPWWKRVLSGPIEGESFEPGSDPTAQYEARRRIEYAFKAISADDRILVTLAELEGWKISEIAQLTSRTEGFVKMRLSRAREKMRRQLSAILLGPAANRWDEGKENLCSVSKPEQD